MLANDIVLHRDEFWKDSKNTEQFESAWNLICRDYAVVNQNGAVLSLEEDLEESHNGFYYEGLRRVINKEFDFDLSEQIENEKNKNVQFMNYFYFIAWNTIRYGGNVKTIYYDFIPQNKFLKVGLMDAYKNQVEEICNYRFSNLVELDDRAFQEIINEVDMHDLSFALKGSEQKLQDKFFNAMTKRAREILKEDLEFMGPARLEDVVDAQWRIMKTIKRLEDEGEIVLPKLKLIEEQNLIE